MVTERLKFNPLRLTFLLLSCFILAAISCGSPLNLFAQSKITVDRTVKLKAVAGLKYSKVRLTVRPGSAVRIILKNTDEMMHNMLIVKPDKRIEVVKAAEAMGESGMKNNFIPESLNVLASTPLLNPGGEASIIFKVPDREAIYPYVCTYPAHGMVMYGALYATNNPEELPSLDEDPNIPEPVRNEMAASRAMHPYSMERPTLTRLFMPESSPAAIAVGMEKNQSYTWDAGYSHLRYVWNGGYIDASKQWDAKAHEVAEVVGDIYYRNTIGFPFRIGHRDSIPVPDFKGYKLIDGYPQFKYKMGNILVKELILPAESSPGFQMQYQLQNVNSPIWYMLSENDGVNVNVSKGEVKERMIRLTPDQARQFSITITANK